jgi:hypothetical protein
MLASITKLLLLFINLDKYKNKYFTEFTYRRIYIDVRYLKQKYGLIKYFKECF